MKMDKFETLKYLNTKANEGKLLIFIEYERINYDARTIRFLKENGWNCDLSWHKYANFSRIS